VLQPVGLVLHGRADCPLRSNANRAACASGEMPLPCTAAVKVIAVTGSP